MQHVEGNVGNGEEFARVGYGETDVGYGEGGKVFRAERQELDGPAPEDYALIPGFEGIGGNGLYGFRDEAHDFVGVVVELMGS